MDDALYDKIYKIIKENSIEFVRMECEDIHGVLRGFTLDVDFFLRNITNGIPITKSLNAFTCNGENVPDTGIKDEIDYRNGYMYPDLKTFQVLPWLQNTAVVLVDFRLNYKDASSHFVPASVRGVCKQQLERLETKGLKLFSAYEYEFYVLDKQDKKPLFEEINLYSTQSSTKCFPLMQDIMRNMKKMKIMPEICHTEFGPAQHEITQSPAFGITSADNALRFKQITKEMSLKHGCISSFMSKPFPGVSGSSGHFNHSVWDINGKNVFFDSTRQNSLSEIAEYWLAGLRYHSKALMCFACPTPNCYERCKPGCFAPVNDSWGFDNRTVTYRVKNLDATTTYLENRLPGAAVNPYLLMAGTIIAGLDGIKNKRRLTSEAFVGDACSVTNSKTIQQLPCSLLESLECLNNNEIFVNEMGSEFMKLFNSIKRYECKKADTIKETEARNKWYLDYYCENI